MAKQPFKPSSVPSVPSGRLGSAAGFGQLPAQQDARMKRFLIALVVVLAIVGGLVVLRGHQKSTRAAAAASAP